MRNRHRRLTRRGHYADVLTEQDISGLDEGIGQRHAEPPGKMVLAFTSRAGTAISGSPSPLIGQMLEGIMTVAVEGPALRNRPRWRGDEALRLARTCVGAAVR